MHNKFFRTLFLVTGLFGQISEAAEEKPAPNVLFIVVDDLRTSLACYGDSQVKSPHIDRLAAKGMLFERAYSQYPVCNPSRSSFLTGMRPENTGILNNESALRLEKPDLVTLPQLFKENGYYSATVGKITHMGVDGEGNTTLFQDPVAYTDFFDGKATELGMTGKGRDLTDGKLPWCKWLAAKGTDEDQPDGQNAAKAVAMIEKHADSPFFIGVGIHKPHDPFFAPEKYFDLYPLEEIELAKEPAESSVELPLAIPNKTDFAGFTDRDRKEFRRAYYAGTSFADAQVGKLLDTLDRLELWDETIVVVMGDHGYHLGEHDWWNKVTVFELCARAPLIIWAPGMKGMGQRTNGIVEFVDLYSTITDLCGLTPPHPQDGKSFRALLENPELPGKDAAFTQVTRGKLMGRSIRTDKWRYTEWEGGDSGIELYDHSVDSLEYQNLAGKPENSSLIKGLSTDLNKVLPR